MSCVNQELTTALINLMGRPKLNPALLQNTAITIGRFGLVPPSTRTHDLV